MIFRARPFIYHAQRRAMPWHALLAGQPHFVRPGRALLSPIFIYRLPYILAADHRDAALARHKMVPAMSGALYLLPHEPLLPRPPPPIDAYSARFATPLYSMYHASSEVLRHALAFKFHMPHFYALLAALYGLQKRACRRGHHAKACQHAHAGREREYRDMPLLGLISFYDAFCCAERAVTGPPLGHFAREADALMPAHNILMMRSDRHKLRRAYLRSAGRQACREDGAKRAPAPHTAARAQAVSK